MSFTFIFPSGVLICVSAERHIGHPPIFPPDDFPVDTVMEFGKFTADITSGAEPSQVGLSVSPICMIVKYPSPGRANGYGLL
jgi:hypothetical protein